MIAKVGHSYLLLATRSLKVLVSCIGITFKEGVGGVEVIATGNCSTLKVFGTRINGIEGIGGTFEKVRFATVGKL